MDKNKTETKENLGKYFIAGIIAAVFIYLAISYFFNDKNETSGKDHIWSESADSNFIKSCFDKYRAQVKDDMQKQQNTKMFCRCMLEKMKTKYSEEDAYKMTAEEVKQWDAECRTKILNPNNINVK